MNDETLEQIQTKIAFLERTANELSDVVFRQHREIEALQVKFAGLSERVSSLQTGDAAHTPDEERPPHY